MTRSGKRATANVSETDRRGRIKMSGVNVNDALGTGGDERRGQREQARGLHRGIDDSEGSRDMH